MAITGKWLALGAALLINSSLAATVSPGDRDVIQNQQQQRLEQDQQQRDALWQAISPQSTPAVAAPDAGRCFSVRHIIIRNATLLSARQRLYGQRQGER